MEKKYFLSELFTLIPAAHYTPQQGIDALKKQFALQGEYTYGRYHFAQADAVMAYAIPDGVCSINGDGEDKPLPLMAKLLEQTMEITHYNKVIFHYSSKKRLSHTVVSAGEELKLANSFRADSFESALYFLFLSIRQLQMNPKQCIVMVCSGITPQQEETIARFFKGVEKNDLDNIIQI